MQISSKGGRSIKVEGVIFPTNTCFDDALDLIDKVAAEKPEELHRLRLVHAICVAPDGYPFSHAWVEDGESVIFTGLFNGERGHFEADRAGYYEYFQVRETTSYSPAQAAWHNLRTGMYGPWEKKYQDLCKDRIQETKLKIGYPLQLKDSVK